VYPGEWARRRADEPLFVFEPSGTVVTFAEYERDANRMAHLLRDVGLGLRDHVAFMVENRPELLVAEGGADRTGLYFTLVNSFLSAEEAAYIVNDCGARVVVASAGTWAAAQELPARCPAVERWLLVGATELEDVGDSSIDVGAYEDFATALAAFPDTHVPDERVGMPMGYSSGTTGQPKGIRRPLAERGPMDEDALFLQGASTFRYREGMTYLSPAPLYHSAPQAAVSTAVHYGATTIVMERFDAALFLELVERHRVTHSQVVPTMLSRLLKLPDEVRAGADVSSLEAVVHAAAPCPVPVKQAIIDWWGPILYEYYSATEAIGATFIDSHDWLAHPGSVGRAMLGEIVVLDDDGDELPAGEQGTVWFRGAASFEYHNDPDKTAGAKDATGNLATVGDVGYVDTDGYLYLTDRKSFMIISGGANIYPQEAENLLVTHPQVLDVAVIGVPDEDLGEAVKAVVQLAPGVAASPRLESELIAFTREHLAHYKCPRSVDFVDELPRLPTGKLYKRILRDRYWEGHASRVL
jgi:acyl-CoA synthetase (AMP-forming)/AMP-acid ligase II